MQIQIYKAATSREINIAFEALARDPPDALFVNPDPFFGIRRVQLATWPPDMRCQRHFPCATLRKLAD